MQPSLRLACSRCGVESAFEVQGVGRRECCPGCRAPIYVPPLGQPAKPQPRKTARRAGDSCLWIWAFGVGAALVLGPGTWWLLKSHADAGEAERADQAVASQVEAARVELSRNHRDEATALLRAALATKNAAHLEEARALWTDMRRQQASGILHAAESALAQRNAAQARSLLQNYLDDEYGDQREKAADLKEQVERATSDAEAAARLRRLTYADLTKLAQTGSLADLGDIKHPDVCAIHLDKLRGFLEAEFQQRREDQNRRAVRIQATPVFGEFRDFVVLTRRRIQAKVGRGDIDRKLLDRLFRELNVNNPNEQQHILQTLSSRPLDSGGAEKIAAMRARFKERFRADKEFDKTDWEMFDWAVDQELNSLLNEALGIAVAAAGSP